MSEREPTPREKLEHKYVLPEWRTPEQLAENRATIERLERTLGAALLDQAKLDQAARKIASDAKEADAASVELDRIVTPRMLRKYAKITVRCQAADGRLLAYVAWFRGRPLMYTNGRLRWLDSGFWGDVVKCRCGAEHVLDAAVLMAYLPGPHDPPLDDVRVGGSG